MKVGTFCGPVLLFDSCLRERVKVKVITSVNSFVFGLHLLSFYKSRGPGCSCGRKFQKLL